MGRIQRLPTKRGGRTSYDSFQIVNPSKGLNTLISDSLIDDKESPSLENIMFVESGAVSKAPGFSQVGNTLSNNPKGLGAYTDTSGNRYLLTTDGSALKYLNSSTWTSISGATFDTASTTQINMTQARGNMYIWDGVNGGAELSSLTLTRPGTMPSAKFSIYYNGFHIAAGVSTKPNRVYISTTTSASDFTNDPTQITTTADPDSSTEVPGATVFTGSGTGAANAAQFIDVNKDDGDKITGFSKFQDALIIFKEKSIFQLNFDSSGVPTVQAVTKSYGCVSHRSIDNVDNDVFFLTRNGVYVLGNEANYFNVIRTNELSARIHPIIESLRPTYYPNATALYSSYIFYLGVTTTASTANDLIVTYDKRFGAFSKWTHAKPECLTAYVDSTNTESVYFTSATSAKVYKFTPGTYSADGSAISASFTTKAFDLKEFSTYKRWILADVYFRQLLGIITVQTITDGNVVTKTSSITGTTTGGIGSDMFGAFLFGGDIDTSVTSGSTSTSNVPYRIRIGTKSRTIKLRFSNERLNENFVLLGYSFAYRRYSKFVFPSSLKIQ